MSLVWWSIVCPTALISANRTAFSTAVSSAALVDAGANVVGAEYKVNLVAPGRGAALLARGVVVKPGRRLIVCRADVLAVAADGAETLCAIAQGAMAVIEPARL